MDSGAPSPADGRQLVLLFGMPRSGTTWLGKLFDSHPHVLYRHEPDDWDEPVLSDENGSSGSQAARLHAFAARLPSIRSLRVAGKRPAFPKAFMSGTGYQAARISTEIARAASRVYSNFPILIHHNGSADPDRYVVWKSIQSLISLGPYLETLEYARGIHILRHPCGYIASILRGVSYRSFIDNSIDWLPYVSAREAVGTELGDRFGFGQNFKQVLDKLSREERLAWHWVLTNEKAKLEAGHTNRYLRVHYEQICREPLAGVQSMFDFAGLDMNDQTRDFIAASTGSSQDGYYSVFKDPLTAAWRWRDELDDSVIAKVMAITGQSEVGAPYVDMAPPQSGPA